MSEPSRVVQSGAAVLLCVAVVVMIALQVIGPADAADEPGVELVELHGTSCVVGLATQWAYPWLLRVPADPPLTVPIVDGDMVHFSPTEEDDCEAVFVYRKEDGPRLNLWCDGPLVRVNGRPNTLFFDEESAEHLALFDDDTLAGLELVIFADLATNHLSQLRRLATINPQVGLGLDLDSGVYTSAVPNDVREVLASFRPRMAVLPDEALEGDPGWRELLAGWTTVQALFASAASPADLEAIAGLPGLTELVLMDWDPEETGPLPSGMDELRRLTLHDAEIGDLDCLAALTGLTQLSVGGLEDGSSLSNITALADLPTLRNVGLAWCEEIHDLEPLYGLQDLERVSFPANATEQQLAEFIEHVPDLRWLDLLSCEAITNLSSLASLNRLEALSVHSGARLEDLASFDHLRYLRVLILDDEEEGPAQRARLARLRETLPDCTVVTTIAPCMGSGYLLLLVPVAALAVLVSRRVRRQRSAES